MSLGTQEAQGFEDTLVAAGAVAITYESLADEVVLEPAPGTLPMWNSISLLALFPVNADMASLSLPHTPWIRISTSDWKWILLPRRLAPVLAITRFAQNSATNSLLPSLSTASPYPDLKPVIGRRRGKSSLS